ncbi:glycosyltransferase family 4 protein [Deltaproteobacteria bacterium]|nr:glycosyltransferase family 4 protein [Deltaproteobacteria bacterium]
MRVVQLLPELNEGGVERGVVELNRELVKRGIESIVVSVGGKQSDQISVDGGTHIAFDVVSKNPLTAPLRVLQLRALIKELQPDILHARSRVPAWLSYLANKPLGIPFVTTVHGFNSVNAYSRVMTFGDRVICVSRAVKDYVQQHYQVPEEKLVVIPRGVDLDLFDPDNLDQDFVDRFKQKYEMTGRFVVASVGRVTQLKDYETFIRAVALAKDDLPNICGLIVGGVRQDKQGYFHLLKKLVSELDADSFIKFVGSQSKIAEIYSLSDVVVSCSKKPESFGRTAAEALAMNVPVIATNHGGVVDIVQNGENGCLIESESPSALAAAITAPFGGKRNYRSWITGNFSLSAMLNSTLEVYKAIGS